MDRNFENSRPTPTQGVAEERRERRGRGGGRNGGRARARLSESIKRGRGKRGFTDRVAFDFSLFCIIYVAVALPSEGSSLNVTVNISPPSRRPLHTHGTRRSERNERRTELLHAEIGFRRINPATKGDLYEGLVGRGHREVPSFQFQSAEQRKFASLKRRRPRGCNSD